MKLFDKVCTKHPGLRPPPYNDQELVGEERMYYTDPVMERIKKRKLVSKRMDSRHPTNAAWVMFQV